MAKSVPHCPLETRASDADNAKGTEYFTENADQIKADLLKYGAIWFRGFDLMKSVQGYREFYESVGLDPCLDPLHSSGLRKFASERDALYEEVSHYVIDRFFESRVVAMSVSQGNYLHQTSTNPINFLFFNVKRSINHHFVDITLVFIVSPQQSVLLHMQPSCAFKRQPKEVEDF